MWNQLILLHSHKANYLEIINTIYKSHIGTFDVSRLGANDVNSKCIFDSPKILF